MPLAATLDAEICEVSDAQLLAGAPLVSVLMVTFNHAGYLAEAIEGVVSQTLEFPFELIIGEDASTDETRKIALEYQRRFPEIIRVVFSQHNVGAGANIRRITLLARGEYIAYCEGDDYWCSTRKLAGQVELIRRDQGIGVVHTDWVRSRPSGNGWTTSWGKPVHRRIRPTLLEGDLFHAFYFPKILRTCTILVRRDVILECEATELGLAEYRFGDTVAAALITSRWKVAYLPEVTAVYRESPGSLLRSGNQAKLEFLKSCLKFDSDARRFFHDRKDYPDGYRCEVLLGILLWALRARNLEAAKLAISDLRKSYGFVRLVLAALQAIRIRWPTMQVQHHCVDSDHVAKLMARSE